MHLDRMRALRRTDVTRPAVLRGRGVVFLMAPGAVQRRGRLRRVIHVTLDARTRGVAAMFEDECTCRAIARLDGELEHPSERHFDVCHPFDLMTGDTASVEPLSRVVTTTAIRRPPHQERSVLDLHGMAVRARVLVMGRMLEAPVHGLRVHGRTTGRPRPGHEQYERDQ
mgnify:CR=1 FL=1